MRAVRNEHRGIDAATRAQKRYAGLPADTPPPDVEYLFSEPGEWDFWEWWAGEGVVTSEAGRMKLKCGPIVTYATGWDLNNSAHQVVLWRLVKAKKPKVIMGEPDCGIWSQSNTTTPAEVKLMIRNKQMSGLKFFADVCRYQSNQKRAFLKEQPKSSELLRHPVSLELLELPNVEDYELCMCSFNLKDPYTKRLHKKPTVLRGSVRCQCSGKWCTGNHTHQLLQGKLPNGLSRTSHAQTYTKAFARAVVRDVAAWLHEHGHLKVALPAAIQGKPEQDYDSDDFEQLLRELGEADEQQEQQQAPQTPRVPPTRQWMEPTPKRLPGRPAPSKESEPPWQPSTPVINPTEERVTPHTVPQPGTPEFVDRPVKRGVGLLPSIG